MRLLCIAALLAVSLSAQTTTLWVDPAGNDTTGNGTEGNPYLTLAKAENTLPVEGGVIVLADGTHVPSGTANSSAYGWRMDRCFMGWVVVRAETRYQARVMRADGSPPLIINNACNVMVTGIEFYRTTSASLPLLVQVSTVTNVIFTDNLLHDALSNDLLKWNLSNKFGLIYDNAFWNAADNAGSSNGQAIDVNGSEDTHIVQNIFFEDSNTGEDSRGSIVVKDSDPSSGSARVLIDGNVMHTYQGGAGANWITCGEDAFTFYENVQLRAQNNLLIGNSSSQMRSPIGVKGCLDSVFVNNTITGDQPARNYAIRVNKESPSGQQAPINSKVYVWNTIYNDPEGNMNTTGTVLGDGFAEGTIDLDLDALTGNDSNVYYANGNAIPQGEDFDTDTDSHKVLTNPVLPDPTGLNGSLSVYNNSTDQFGSGETTITAEFRRLVDAYGELGTSSSAVGAANANAPRIDIRRAVRDGSPDIGAAEDGSSWPSGIQLIIPQWDMPGQTEYPVALVRLPTVSTGEYIYFQSSDPGVAAVVDSVYIPAGLDRFPFKLSFGDQGGTATITAARGITAQGSRIGTPTGADASASATGSEVVTVATDAPIHISLHAATGRGNGRASDGTQSTYAGHNLIRVHANGLQPQQRVFTMGTTEGAIVTGWYPSNRCIVPAMETFCEVWFVAAEQTGGNVTMQLMATDEDGDTFTEPTVFTILDQQAITRFELFPNFTSGSVVTNGKDVYALVEIAEAAGPGGYSFNVSCGATAEITCAATATVPEGETTVEVHPTYAPTTANSAQVRFGVDNAANCNAGLSASEQCFGTNIRVVRSAVTGCAWSASDNSIRITAVSNTVRPTPLLFPDYQIACALSIQSDPSNVFNSIPTSFVFNEASGFFTSTDIRLTGASLTGNPGTAGLRCVCEDGLGNSDVTFDFDAVE